MKRIHIVTIILTCLASGCAAKVDQRGYVPYDNWKEQVRIGASKDEVVTALGSPSSQSAFGTETWYYISGRKEAQAFFKPEVVKQDVIRIEFDQAGMVSKVETFDENSRQDLRYVKRTTPTEGHTLGFVEQILGNIGRFNKSDSGSVAPGGRRKN
jgi:outer membrane protein assembly factor BamE (lipoprotein component of BamABCDE complex)